LIKIAPYFVVTILIQVIVKRFVHVHFLIGAKSDITSILLSALLGLISPLPTYGAVVIGLSFISLGVPFHSVIPFIVASPLINPGIFFLTVTQLGLTIL